MEIYSKIVVIKINLRRYCMEQTISNDNVVQIICSLNNFKDEMLKSMNYLREDMNYLKEDMSYIKKDIRDLKDDVKDLRVELKEFKEETNRRWEENNKRWDENDRRWEENEKRWIANDKKWEQYDKNRIEDRDTIINILLNYDVSISEQLGDPNTEKCENLSNLLNEIIHQNKI